MKYVKEHINEKFIEDSDPIKDLGIGFRDSFDFSNVNRNYKKDTQLKLSKIITKERRKISAELRKKLVGKVITGDMYRTKNYDRKTDFSVRVSKIRIIFSNSLTNDYIFELFVYSPKGISYTLFNTAIYKITM